jgi:hypothetical protein
VQVLHRQMALNSALGVAGVTIQILSFASFVATNSVHAQTMPEKIIRCTLLVSLKRANF